MADEFEQPKIDPALVRVRYKEACKKAEDRSRMYACTVHVNAQVGLLDGEPVIHHFGVSDWYDGSTLATYTGGTLVMSHAL